MTPADRDGIAARVALAVRAAADSVDVAGAVDAAIAFVAVTELGVEPPDDPVAAVRADPLTTQGLFGFSRSLYVDALAARGASVAVGDGTVDTVFTPEDIYRHWRHYFVPLAAQWGVA